MTKRTIKGIIAMLMLLTVCLYFVSGTYARYTSAVSGNTKADIAKWAVAFKDGKGQALTNDFNLTFKVDENENVVSNKIAPQTSATAEIEVDLTGTEVAVDYEANVDQTTLVEWFGDSATDVTVETIATINGTQDTTGKIALIDDTAFTADNGKVKITVKLTWTNNEAHNVSDTTVGEAGGTLTLPVTLTLKQHID